MPNLIAATAVSLTSEADTIMASPEDQLVSATSATLNPSDRLAGGGGQDTLELTGSGDFHFDRLAEFSGFEAVHLTNTTGAEAKIWMRSGEDVTLTINPDVAAGTITGDVSVFLDKARVTLHGGVEDDRFYASAPSELAAGSVLDGGGGANDYLFLTYSYLSNQVGTDPATGVPIFSPNSDTVYDLTKISVKGVEKLNISGASSSSPYATVAKVDTASLADVRIIYGDDVMGGISRLTTDAATLDLTGKSVRFVTVWSANASGTTFTTDSADTAMQISGGIGKDKVVVTGVTLTEQERAVIFSSSVEIIQDASGTYRQPTPQPSDLSMTSSTVNGVSVAMLEGKAEAGATIDVYAPGHLIATTQVDANGRFIVALPPVPSGEHGIWTIATNSFGSSTFSTSFQYASGTAAEIVSNLDSYYDRWDLGGIFLTGSHVLPFASFAEMEHARLVYAHELAYIVSDYSFSVTTVSSNATILDFYTASGHLSERVTTEADGDKLIDRYALDGTKLSQTYLHDGVREEHAYVVTGKPYARQDAVYDANNKLISMERSYADGKPALSQMVRPDGSQAVTQWSPDGTKTVLAIDTAGRLTTIETETAQGVRTLSETRAADGSKEVHFFNGVTGKETGSLVVHADKSQVKTEYVANKPYAEQTLVFDTKGKLLSVERHYGDGTLNFSTLYKADGTAEVHGYDTGGRETVRIAGNLSGERDTFEYSYAGASKIPVTMTQNHYGVGNVKLWSDQTTADGSHIQVAKAAGAALVSHAGVADTFTGLKGGADTFTFGQGFGKDTVVGFESARDTLRFDDRLVVDLGELVSKMSKVGNDTLITIDASDTVLLKNVAPSAITADHVHFFHDGLLV